MTTLTNWQKFDKAFNLVSAYVVMDQDTMQPIAKIALKFPTDGAGRVNAYIHIIGMEVQHGFAGGYGYDKRTASIVDCIHKMFSAVKLQDQNINSKQKQFIDLLLSDDAQGGWQEVINNNNGFVVIQAV
jgi:hypothetical protein